MTKLPYFPLYADDLIGGTVNMSPAEFGAYMRLLCYQWGNGSIPNEPEEIALIAGAPVSQKVLAKFMAGQDGRLRNARLETERARANDFHAAKAESGRKGAEKRWHSHQFAISENMAQPSIRHWQNDSNHNQNHNQNHIHTHNQSHSQSHDVSPRPSGKPKSPPRICDDAFVEELRPLYPAINIDAELRKMDAWLLTKPHKKKTRGFVVNWLNRADPAMAATATTATDHEHGF